MRFVSGVAVAESGCMCSSGSSTAMMTPCGGAWQPEAPEVPSAGIVSRAVAASGQRNGVAIAIMANERLQEEAEFGKHPGRTTSSSNGSEMASSVFMGQKLPSVGICTAI